jgi:hypothetical protein
MNAYTRAPILLLGLFALVGITAPSPLAGQGSDSAPIFLALPETFPDVDARAVLMREPGRDIVILAAADAEAETLQVALQLLSRLRREHPSTLDRGQLVPITGFAPLGPMDPDERRRLESVLAQLRQRPLANVGDLGWGRWMPYRER